MPTLALAAVMAAVVALIKVWPTVQRQQLESDASLRVDLLRRVGELEDEVKQLRKSLDRARMSHAAEMMDMLHDLSNESAQLDAAIMLAEHSPETLIAQLPRIRQQRDQHRERLVVKRGAREAAIMAVTLPDAAAAE